ncbi:hypothetical protein [Streptomyces sp. NPDC021356]|uniref:hypothetical protein n=1 Tax=Streptomyces sp. NPDC021356 TaxID=3154900 RepID=UPI0033F6EEDF
MKFRDSRVPCGGELTYDIAKLLKEVAQTGGHGIALVVPGCSPGHVDRAVSRERVLVSRVAGYDVVNRTQRDGPKWPHFVKTTDG